MIASSNVSLSNLCVTTKTNLVSQFSFSNLYNATNVSSLPNKAAPMAIGFFRGLTILPDTPVPTATASVTATSLSGTNGSAVSSWGIFSQATASKQPILVTAGTPFQFVQFTGTNVVEKVMISNTMNFNTGTNGGATVVLVCRYPSYVLYQRSFSYYGGSGPNFEWIAHDNQISNRTHTVYLGDTLNQVVVPSTNVPTNTWMTLVCRIVNGSNTKFLRNGSGASNTLGTQIHTYNAANTTSAAIRLAGNDFGGTNNRLDLYHMSYYDKPLSDAEITSVCNQFTSIVATFPV
jgi:hypothetical protein